LDTRQYVSELGLANSAAVVHPTNTVMLSRTASVGHVVRIGRPMATTQAFVTWTCGPLLDPRFLVLTLNAMKPEFERIAYGSTHLTIYMPDIEQLRIPVPPVETQRKIAAYLETEIARVDGLLAKRREVLSLLDQRDVALAHSAITGQILPGPRKRTAIRWLGDLPADWNLAPVSSQFRVALGRMLNAERATGESLRPYVRNVNVRWDVVDTTDLAKMDFPLADRARYRLRPGDLLINEGGAGIGRAAIWDAPVDECYFQKSVLRLRPTGHTQTRWMVECMRVAVDRKVFLVEGNLATIPHVPAEALRVHRFPFPPESVQSRLLEWLADQRRVARHVRSLVDTQIARLVEHRQALITAAVTGELDIPGVAA